MIGRFGFDVRYGDQDSREEDRDEDRFIDQKRKYGDLFFNCGDQERARHDNHSRF